MSFHCPEDIARERVLGRRGNREGDDNETFTRRHNEFELLNPEILKHYSGKLLKVRWRVIVHHQDTNDITVDRY